MLALLSMRRNRPLSPVELVEFGCLPLSIAAMAAISVFQLDATAMLDRDAHLDAPSRPGIMPREAIAAAASVLTPRTRVTRPEREPDI
jgi:hypothetical protein